MTRPQIKLDALIAAQMRVMNVTTEELAAALGMSRTTLYQRRNNLGTMTLDELRKLNRFLHIGSDDLKHSIEL